MGLILNSKVKLRKDEQRILVYTSDDFTEQPGEVCFIHPAYAVLLTMFDGKKDYRQILESFCGMIEQEVNEENLALIEKQLGIIKERLGVESLFIKESIKSEKRYNPEDFVIPTDQVELKPTNSRIDFPLIINFNVTSRCKLDCKYCYHPRDKIEEEISLERLAQLFDECKEKGCQFILLSGGDPFERDDILDIMEMLKKRRITYFISTKSFLNQELCYQLKERAGLDRIQLSLDSSDPEMADFLTGGSSGFLERTLETIDNLNRAKIRVGLRTVVSGYNVDYLTEFLDFCSQLDVERVQLVQYLRSIWRHEDGLFATEEQLTKANQIIDEYKEKLKNLIIEGGNFTIKSINGREDRDRGVCDTCRKSITLLPNGKVTVCEQLPYKQEVILGDLKEETIEEFWNSRRSRGFISPPDRTKYNEKTPCYSCDEEDYQSCHQEFGICIKDSYHYFGDFNSPDINCQKVKVDNFRTR